MHFILLLVFHCLGLIKYKQFLDKKGNGNTFWFLENRKCCTFWGTFWGCKKQKWQHLFGVVKTTYGFLFFSSTSGALFFMLLAC